MCVLGVGRKERSGRTVDEEITEERDDELTISKDVPKIAPV